MRGSDRPGTDGVLRERLLRTVVWPVWALLAVAVVVFLVGLDLPLWVQYAPLVASAVILGMPHGAVDHVATARVTDRPLFWEAAALVVGVYLLLGIAYLAGWFLAPALAAAFFILLTWFHWGQGDVYLLVALTDGDYPRSRPHRALTLVVRGAMPMAVPLLAFPDQYRQVVADLVGLFGETVDPVAWAFGAELRTGLAVALLALTALTLVRGAVDTSGRTLSLDRGLRIDAAELALLWVFFLAVPPVLAVGLYFCVWHSARHVARVVLLDDRAVAALRAADLTDAFGRFARDAAPLTALALALLAVLYPLVPQAPTGLGEGVGLYLVLIAVLTLPHVAVVTLMDHEQGIWSTGP